MNWFSSCDITTSFQVWTSWFFRWEASRETFCLQRVCLTGFNTDMWSVEYQLNREGHFLELTIVFKDCGPFYVRCLWRFRLPWHWRHPLQHQRTSEETYNLKNMIYNIQFTVIYDIQCKVNITAFLMDIFLYILNV